MTTTEAQGLEDLDFGRYDAEGDSQLLDYFLETGDASQAKKGKRLIIGRKGSGKTALFTYVKSSLSRPVVPLDLFEYVFEAHRNLLEEGINNRYAFTTSWRILMYAAMYGAIRGDIKSRDRRTGDEALRALGMGGNKKAIRKILDWLSRIDRVDLPGIEGIGSLGGFERSSPDEDALSMQTSAAIRSLQGVVEENYADHPATILVDRLDDAWDGSDYSKDLLVGAVRAGRAICDKLQARGQTAPVIIFLRTDIWEKLSFNDKNKSDQGILDLDWSPEDLKAVIEKRISHSLNVPEDEAWARVFSTTPMRQQAKMETYLIKRTLGRPRDIVAFCGKALEIAQHAGHAKIEPDDVYEAETGYSRHMLGELRDEIETHVKDFSLVVNVLRRIGKKTFSPFDLHQSAQAYQLDAVEIEAIEKQLFEASAVGVFQTGGATGGSRTKFRYEDRYLGMHGEGLQLQVHTAFIKELGIIDR